MNTLLRQPSPIEERKKLTATEQLIEATKGLNDFEVFQLIQLVIASSLTGTSPQGESQSCRQQYRQTPAVPENLELNEQTIGPDHYLFGWSPDQQKIIAGVVDCIYPFDDKLLMYPPLQNILDQFGRGGRAIENFVARLSSAEKELLISVKIEGTETVQVRHAESVIKDMVELLDMNKCRLACHIIDTPREAETTLANILYFLSQYIHIELRDAKGWFIHTSRVKRSEVGSCNVAYNQVPGQEFTFNQNWEYLLKQMIERLGCCPSFRTDEGMDTNQPTKPISLARTPDVQREDSTLPPIVEL